MDPSLAERWRSTPGAIRSAIRRKHLTASKIAGQWNRPLALTRKQAAEICGVSVDTIGRAINSVHLRAERTGRRREPGELGMSPDEYGRTPATRAPALNDGQIDAHPTGADAGRRYRLFLPQELGKLVARNGWRSVRLVAGRVGASRVRGVPWIEEGPRGRCSIVNWSGAGEQARNRARGPLDLIPCYHERPRTRDLSRSFHWRHAPRTSSSACALSLASRPSLCSRWTASGRWVECRDERVHGLHEGTGPRGFRSCKAVGSALGRSTDWARKEVERILERRVVVPLLLLQASVVWHRESCLDA